MYFTFPNHPYCCQVIIGKVTLDPKPNTRFKIESLSPALVLNQVVAKMAMFTFVFRRGVQ